jgi:hypothetical protein
MTKQIIHNSEGSAQAEIISLEAKLKHLHSGVTTNYNYYIKHPTDNKWAVRYNTSGKYWNIVEEHLNPHQLNLLVEITNDWKAEEL